MKSEDYIESLRRKRRLRKIRFFIILLVIFSLITFYFIAFKTNIFSLKNIIVEGNEIVLEEDILNTSTLTMGANLLSVKKNKIEKNIKSLSYIESVEIEKEYPSNIRIRIKERKKAMQINLADSYQLVDVKGYILENSDQIDPELPQVINLYQKPIGEKENIFKSLGNEPLEIYFKSLEEVSLLNKMHTINFENEENVVMSTKEGIVVDFGDLDSVEYKVKLLNEVMADLREKNIGYQKIIMNKGSNPIIIRKD